MNISRCYSDRPHNHHHEQSPYLHHPLQESCRMHPLGRVLAFSQKCRLFSTNVIDPNSIQPKLCVVGSGPASFYAAQQILKVII
ncbi:Protein of unknown function [Gryllus bimaculatus]|nr:Protein of unknown function [Gryllus bimaculatus]